MPYKKKAGNLEKKVARPASKRHTPLYLEAPPELLKVVVENFDLPKEAKSAGKPSAKELPIAIMHHAPSRHLADLRQEPAPRQVLGQGSRNSFKGESGLDGQESGIKHASEKQKQIKRPFRKPLNFPSLFISNLGTKTHSRRIGAHKEPPWINAFSELAVIHAAWMLVKLLWLIFGFIRVSRQAHGAVKICIGKACAIIKIRNPKSEIRNIFIKKSEGSKVVKPKIVSPAPIFQPSFSYHKALLSFVCIALVFVLPLKGLSYYSSAQTTKKQVITKSQQGVRRVMNAAQMAKYSPELAAIEFEKATLSFSEAARQLDRVSAVVRGLSRLTPRTAKELQTGKFLVSSAEHLSRVAGTLTTSIEIFRHHTNLINKISELRNRLAKVLPDLVVVRQNMAKIDASVLGVDAASFDDIRQNIDSVSGILNDFVGFGDTLLSLLGSDHPKKYLFLFQNNTEIRPTGGFIGTIAEATFDRGEIKNIYIPGGGSYDLKGNLRVRVAPPEPLRLVASTWQFQDANWFPDFPTTANKIIWFYERAGGPTVDGVIAINAKVIQDLLKVIGPIDMPAYGKVITADNFLLETQKAVEVEYDKALNQPKKFIADLVPEFMETLASGFNNNYFEITDILGNNLRSRDLQIAFREAAAESKMRELNWTGEIKPVSASTDYLLVVNSNIAGQKSDAKIQQKILHRADIADDGTITNTIMIVRKHLGEKGELFTGAKNVNYLRLYAPLGSVLVEASGFEPPPENLFKDTSDAQPDDDVARVSGSFAVHRQSGTLINSEFGKTVFGNWTQTSPGEESLVIFKYRLPWKTNESPTALISASKKTNLTKYSLFVQKQSGVESEFTSEVFLGARKLTPVTAHPETWKGSGNLYEIKDKLDSDKFYSLLLQ